MKRDLITELEARELFNPHYEQFVEIFQNSFATYNSMQNYLNTKKGEIFHDLKTVTKSTLIWNYSLSWAKHFFNENEDIKFIQHAKNSHWFCFYDLVYVRFKKLDNSLKPSNVKTKRIIQLYQQSQIPGFPYKPTFIEAGYTTNKTMTEINNVYLVCWSQGIKKWYIDLTHEIDHQLVLFESPEDAKKNVQGLIRIRQEFIKHKKQYGNN